MMMRSLSDVRAERTTPSVGETTTTGGRWWGGLTAMELRSIYKSVHALGTLSKAHYIVDLEPFDPNGPLKNVALFHQLPTQAYYDFAKVLPWLATETEFSVLDAQNDSVQIGHFQQNFITGNSGNTVNVTFLDTEDGNILASAQAIKNIMFRGDGTQGLPAEYLMWLTISLVRRDDRDHVAVSNRRLVALQATSVDLAGQDRDPLVVPLTFIKMYPMIKG
jgi:hypothetical protein